LVLGVSFVGNTLAKSSKIFPVLIMSVIIGKKSYSWKKYFTVSMITFGIFVFMYEKLVTPQTKIRKNPKIIKQPNTTTEY
jgi:hypothetical protein